MKAKVDSVLAQNENNGPRETERLHANHGPDAADALCAPRAIGRLRTLAAWAVLIALFVALFTPTMLARADTVSGRAFVGGSWYENGQSYFSVTVEGRATVGWCLNPGAARPLSGWYNYTAQRSVSGAGGTTDLWLEGSLSPIAHDAATGASRTGSVTFRAGTTNAHWDVTAPAGCTLYVDGVAYAPGTSARILPGQSACLEIADPLSVGDGTGTVFLEGTAHANASTVTTYRNIVITPPGAWDGSSHHNGLPAGYQRVGVGPITFSSPRTGTATLRASAQLAATVRYFVDSEETPCFSERVPVGSTFTPSPQADIAGAKPDCTPGLDAWYWEASCASPVAPFTVTGDFDVYGRNLATLHYAPAANSALQHETPAQSSPEESAPRVSLSSLLPTDRVLAWGSSAVLERMPVNVLYLHDGERWRTLRRPDEGWHRAESALDEAVDAVRIEHDTTVYDYWTKSTYDGVLDW